MNITVIDIIIILIMSAYFLVEKYLIPKKLEEIKINLGTEIVKLRSDLNKNQFIHKLQFEKEFEIYLYLWEKIGHLKEVAEEYFGILDLDPNEKSEFFDPFVNEWKDVNETILIREPFIAEDVYEQTEKLIKMSAETLAKFKNPITADQDELRKIKDEFFEICAGIGKAIRRRIIV